MRRVALVFAFAAAAVVVAPAAGAFPTLGEQRVLILPATWGPEPFSVAQIEAVAKETDDWVRRASFGKAWLSTVTTPWLRVPSTRGACNPARVTEDAKAAAAAAGFDLTKFSRYAVIQPEGVCAFGGVALGFEVLVNGRLHYKVLAHELGHTWGLGHASSRECDTGACQYFEYGDRYDVMGWGTGDFNAYEKAALDWVTALARPGVDAATVVDVAAIERPSSLPQALVVRTGAGEFWLEYRSEHGLAAPWALPWHELVPGILVRTDAPPGTTERYEHPILLADAAARGRAALSAGERFSVPGAFTVRVAGVTEAAARLELWWTDRRQPTAPRVRIARGTATWTASVDTGSGLDHYEVAFGGKARRLPATTRSVRVGGATRLTVTAVDRAGNRSGSEVNLRLPRGSKVDIGGRGLWLGCRGSGTPTIVLDAGLGNGSDTWEPVWRELSRVSRVCAYDRAGVGRSDARATTQTVGSIVADLRELLTRARVPAPYVLGGHSLGGDDVLLFAARHPDATVGLVLVDSPDPVQLAARGVVSAGFETVDVRDAAALGGVTFAAMPIAVLESTNRPGVPLPRSSNTTHVISNTGHYIHFEKPRLVAEAFREVVAAARSGAALPPCARGPFRSLGGTCLASGG
jgi:hypothetical protein